MILTVFLCSCDADTTNPQAVETANGVPASQNAQDAQDAQPMNAEAAGTTDAQAVGTNRKLTSPVWGHFKKQKIDGVDKAICNYCGKKLSAKSRNGTTHLQP